MHCLEDESLNKELYFKTSRSGGAGGQHVNKVSSKVELCFDITNSLLFDEEQKQRILTKLKNKITKEGVLRIVVQAARSQAANKETAIKKFYTLLNVCFAPTKKRKPTKPTKASQQKRLESKKKISQLKKQRGSTIL